MTVAVETAPHEFSANYIYTTHGLTPYFALDSVRKQSGGSLTTTVHYDGRKWTAKLYYSDSGFVPPIGGMTPQGTDFELESVPEMEIHISRHSDEDPVGEQKAHFNVSPRWQGMKTENDEGEREKFNVPDGITEGINVSAKGANIEFHHYQKLLLRAVASFDVNKRYFTEPHDYSNIKDAERYVRLNKERSGPVHARDGPISQMAHLLESDREGYRKLVQNEQDERNRNLPGYYHTVTLGNSRIREAFPSHKLPKEIKHYYAREAYSKPDTDALAHPKLGASYQVSKWDGKLGVEPDDLSRLNEELEETVLSVLAEAGLNVRPSADPDRDPKSDPDPDRQFVEDAYFEPVESDRDRQIIALDLTEIESHQESIVLSHVADGLSPVEWESLEALVTDGGTVAPADIAEQYDRHADSVRRAINRLPDLIEHDYGEVKLRSDHIAEHVHQAVKDARDATRRAVEATAKAKEAAEKGVDETTGAFMAWCARQGIEVDDRRDARLTLRMDGVGDRQRAVNRAFALWKQAGKDAVRFREARLQFEEGYADAWQWLR